jgi:hypothetical protein
MRNILCVVGVASMLLAVGGTSAFPLGRCVTCGKPAPAPEIGASSLGVLLAAGFAFYAKRNRR